MTDLVVKTCRICKLSKPLSQFHTDRAKKDGHRSECKTCACARVRAYLSEHRAESNARVSAWMAANPGKAGEYRRRGYHRNRVLVFNHYGWSCACCGSNSQPTLDHVNGDGQQHRAKIGRDPGKMYAWVIRQGFPNGFQTLCLRCNQSKGTGKNCRISHAKEVVNDGRTTV